jgi:hypothetical protein
LSLMIMKRSLKNRQDLLEGWTTQIYWKLMEL